MYFLSLSLNQKQIMMEQNNSSLSHKRQKLRRKTLKSRPCENFLMDFFAPQKRFILRAFQKAEVQKSTKKISHGLDLKLHM